MAFDTNSIEGPPDVSESIPGMASASLAGVHIPALSIPIAADPHLGPSASLTGVLIPTLDISGSGPSSVVTPGTQQHTTVDADTNSSQDPRAVVDMSQIALGSSTVTPDPSHAVVHSGSASLAGVHGPTGPLDIAHDGPPGVKRALVTSFDHTQQGALDTTTRTVVVRETSTYSHAHDSPDKAALKTRIGELEHGLQQTITQARDELRKQNAGFFAAYQRYVEQAHDAAQVEQAQAVAAERQKNQAAIQDIHRQMLQAVKQEDVLQQRIIAQSHSHHMELTEQSMHYEQQSQAAVRLQQKHTEQLLAQVSDASDQHTHCVYEEAEAALAELQEEARVAERLHIFQLDEMLEKNKATYDQGYQRLYQEANQALAEERGKAERAEKQAQLYKDDRASFIHQQQQDYAELE